ncbi:DUF3883 domain-containing protein [uncultured Barnesiella sp.]|jgi:hypothetical protein|uniref:DUF3883 domain-containing protein n=1 Tax=uncultured Barnesiella sp. TaxID=584861 RepID=UPI002596C4DF|nr:DUF3883 domain-containing protein [uncultured Barnesiella sp.]
MLNERISRFSNIGNRDGIFFVYKSLLSGVTSITSLKQFVMHHPGHLDVEVDATIMLYADLNMLVYDEENDIISLTTRNLKDLEQFINILSKKLFDFAVREGILNIDTLSYDMQVDRFYIDKKCISLRYACIRNLLISLGIFERRSDTSYYVFSEYVNKAIPHIKNKRKLSQELLLKILEQEAEQGVEGEAFVLEYEKRRLAEREDLDAIKQVSIIDVGAGYDIISYDGIDSTKLDRLIEVKTFKGKPHFHWSFNEMNEAKLRMDHYYLYLVSYDEMREEGYHPIIIKNPIKYFKENSEWQSSIDSIMIKKV